MRGKINKILLLFNQGKNWMIDLQSYNKPTDKELTNILMVEIAKVEKAKEESSSIAVF